MPALEDVSLEEGNAPTLFNAAVVVPDEDKLAARWRVLTKVKDVNVGDHPDLGNNRLSRLENASWRLWFQKRNNLRTADSRHYRSSPPPDVNARFDILDRDSFPALLTKLSFLQESTQIDGLDLHGQSISPSRTNGTECDDASLSSDSTGTVESFSDEQGAAASVDAVVAPPVTQKKRKTVRFDESLNRTAFLCDDESERFERTYADELSLAASETDEYAHERFLWQMDSDDEYDEDSVFDDEDVQLALALRTPLLAEPAKVEPRPTRQIDQPSILDVLEALCEGSQFELMLVVIRILIFFRWCVGASFLSQAV